MTVFDKIKSMDINEFAEWIAKNFLSEDEPISNWWARTYCNNCEQEKGYVEELGCELNFAWCELHDRCKYFKDINHIPKNKEVTLFWLESDEENIENKE